MVTVEKKAPIVPSFIWLGRKPLILFLSGGRVTPFDAGIDVLDRQTVVGYSLWSDARNGSSLR